MICIVLTIALLQFVMVILEFHFMKECFTGDEVYSFATANSSEAMNPLVDMDGTLHINEWLTPEQLLRAVVVSEDEVFSYGHINEILEYDAHPPLYFYLLHFFSSFFIGRFSWIPVIIINSLAIFAGMIYFYRLFLLISKNRLQAIFAMLFFGCTSAVINLMTFARNYTLMTSFTVIFTFYIFRSMQERSLGQKNTKSIILAAVFLYLASMTQYIAIMFGFFITLFVCIYYLLKKDIRSMLKTGLSMTASIGMMILSFHYIITQLTTDQTAMENASTFPYSLDLRVSAFILLNEVFGIKISVYPTMVSFWIFWGCVGLLIVYLIMRFLFRTDDWFKNIENKCLTKLKTLLRKSKNLQVFQYLSLLVTVIALVMIISYKFKIYFYYPTSNRYLFILYPFVAILVLVPAFRVLRYSILQILLVIGLSVLSLSFGNKTNIGPSEISISEAPDIFNGADVMIVVPNHFYANHSTLFLGSCNRIFYTTRDTFYENTDWFADSLSDDRPLYLLYLWPPYADSNVNSDMLDFLKDLEDLGVTTINANPKNHGAKLVAGIGGHALLRLR
ncbi:MAG: hypothetical protein J5829_06055 [Lachnospiraceae bacterium]|nr:hypothetical protein [Lachnospiraceae bacterium]